MPITLRIAAVLFAVLGFFQCIYDFTHDLRYPPEGWKMVVASLVLAALADGLSRSGLAGTISVGAEGPRPKKEANLLLLVGSMAAFLAIAAAFIFVAASRDSH